MEEEIQLNTGSVKKRSSTAFFGYHRNLNIIKIMLNFLDFTTLISLYQLNKNMKGWLLNFFKEDFERVKKIKEELKIIYPNKRLQELHFRDLFILLKNGHSLFSYKHLKIPEVILGKKFDEVHSLDFKDFIKQFNYSCYEVDLMSEFYIYLLTISRKEVLSFHDVRAKGNSLALKILAKFHKALSGNLCLRILSLSSSLRALNEKQTQVKGKLLDAIFSHHKLVCVDLSKNDVLDEKFSGDLKNLRFNKTLLKLNLNENAPTKDQNKFFFSLLHENNSLKQLFYSGNSVHNQDCNYISYMLKENKSLVVLCLDNNMIESGGFITVCEGLKYNKTLQRLTMQKNVLSKTILPSLFELLQNNNTLKVIDISKNVNLEVTEEERKILDSFNGRVIY